MAYTLETQSPITIVRFCPDNRLLLATSSNNDHSVRIWDLGSALKNGLSSVQCKYTLQCHASVSAVDFCPKEGSDICCTLDQESEVIVWSFVSQKCEKTIKLVGFA